jgi:hypothetical protein
MEWTKEVGATPSAQDGEQTELKVSNSTLPNMVNSSSMRLETIVANSPQDPALSTDLEKQKTHKMKEEYDEALKVIQEKPQKAWFVDDEDNEENENGPPRLSKAEFLHQESLASHREVLNTVMHLTLGMQMFQMMSDFGIS